MDRHQQQIGGRLAHPRTGQVQPPRILLGGQQQAKRTTEKFGGRPGRHLDRRLTGGHHHLGEGHARRDVPVLAQPVPVPVPVPERGPWPAVPPSP
ncbi:hypothetical protein ACKI1J_11265 [Streptomyces scabiei]|uniref:hypothetical protein n=1 Tax=Streptomyces scabiei TaxID=1930 RepID=UPI0038F817A0